MFFSRFELCLKTSILPEILFVRFTFTSEVNKYTCSYQKLVKKAPSLKKLANPSSLQSSKLSSIGLPARIFIRLQTSRELKLYEF